MMTINTHVPSPSCCRNSRPGVLLGLGTASKHSEDSAISVAVLEDMLVTKCWDAPAGHFAALIELTARAFERQDSSTHLLENQDLLPLIWVWPILEHDRHLVSRLRQEHPVGPSARASVSVVLDELTRRASIDEVACGAFKALRTIAFRAGAIF